MRKRRLTPRATLKLTPKLVVIVAVLVTVLVIAVYGVTVLFTQTVPGPGITKPGAGAVISNCSSLTLPVSSVGATTSDQSGYWSATCNGKPAFNVTTEGVFLPSVTVQSVCCGASYYNVALVNYTGIPDPTPSYCTGTGILYSSTSMVLSQGAYYYCLNWSLNSYTANTPSSFPTVTITRNSP